MSEHIGDKRAIDLMRDGIFPHDFALVPVAGKATYVKGWQKRAMDRTAMEYEYKLNQSYRGLGVVTGDFSKQLIALDIDGPSADEKYRELAGDDYKPFGQEETWTITSGREGRRQIFWHLPATFEGELRDFKKLALHKDGTWHEKDGDPLNKDEAKKHKEEAKEEELVFRYNRCQSVLPGSPHPITKKRYQFANDCRKVEMAPRWVVDIVLKYRKIPSATGLFTSTQLEAAEKATKDKQPACRDTQMRGWFWKHGNVFTKLKANGFRDIYSDDKFRLGNNWKRKDDNNKSNFCPFHGGDSGTSFVVNEDTGDWYCFADYEGGDLVTFMNCWNKQDIHAGIPEGMELEEILRELSELVGHDFDEFTEVTYRENRKMTMSDIDLLDKAAEIMKEIRDPARRMLQLRDLINEANCFGMKPKELMALVRQHQRYVKNGEHGIERPRGWTKLISKQEAVIPGLLLTNKQYMIHARGGVGKSAFCMSLAKMVGLGLTTKVRGLDVQAVQGNVIWVSNDQGGGQLEQLLMEQCIEEEHADWLTTVDNWMSDQHDDLVEIINRVKPKLIVMDSLSTVIEGEENKGDYADYLYELSRCNGDPTRNGGFEGCCIIWIHHNRKDGTDFRGSDRIQNAVDEVWAIRKLTDEEEAEHGVRKRIVTVGKSRMNRSGDEFMASMDREYNLHVQDMTPTLQREGNHRDGDIQADCLMLGVLAGSEKPLTRHELRETLNLRMQDQGVPKKELITDWGIRKFIIRWKGQQLIEESDVHTGGRGRPTKVYRSRGVREKLLSTINPEDVHLWPALALEYFGVAHIKHTEPPLPQLNEKGNDEHVEPPAAEIVEVPHEAPHSDLGESPQIEPPPFSVSEPENSNARPDSDLSDSIISESFSLSHRESKNSEIGHGVTYELTDDDLEGFILGSDSSM